MASAGTRSVGAHDDENLNTETTVTLVRMMQIRAGNETFTKFL